MITMPAPGAKRQAVIDVNGQSGLPATFIRGRRPGPTVLVVSGIHGGEYAAILTAAELARELEPPEVRGGLVIIHPANPQGFQKRWATVLPEDGRNVNGLFYDDAYQGPAAHIARILAELQSISDFYLDLHAADLFEETAPLACYPATGDEAVTRASRRAALMVNAPAVIRSKMPGAGITEAARRGVPALLIKRGGAGGSCRREEVDLYKKDVVNVLRHLGVLAGAAEPPPSPPEEMDPVYLRSPRPGLWRPAAPVGRKVAAGQILGELTDFFGNDLTVFSAQKDGRVLYGLQALSAGAEDILLVY